MQIGVFGINHKMADVALRELIAMACSRRFSLTSDTSFVLLSTCNRTEIYFSGANLPGQHQDILAVLREEIPQEGASFEQKCYSFFGYDCFTHLVKVTVGLDSAILHESEIQGQVKAAYIAASNVRRLDWQLHLLFQKGLKIAKEVRFKFPSPRTLLDLEHALFLLVNHFFQGAIPAMLFIGASEINLKIATFFLKKGLDCKKITFTNHNYKNALARTKDLNTLLLPWEELQECWLDYKCIIAGSKHPNYVLQAQHALPQNSNRKLLIDLAVPRNIAPELAPLIGAQLFNIDDLNLLLEERKDILSHVAEKAERYVEAAVQRQLTIIGSKDSFRSVVA